MNKKRNRARAKISRQFQWHDKLPCNLKLPEGAVLADQAQQVPNNSYSPPPAFYLDLPFTCIDCGSKELWTAEQQKWYYEVAKGTLYATAARCRSCRKKEQERNNGRGDPNPFKHIGDLIKRVRIQLELSLSEAGFEFEEQRVVIRKRVAWFDFARSDLLFHCLFCVDDEARLIAETLGENAEYRLIANHPLGRPHLSEEIQNRIDEFVSLVQEYLQRLPDVTDSESST